MEGKNKSGKGEKAHNTESSFEKTGNNESGLQIAQNNLNQKNNLSNIATPQKEEVFFTEGSK